MTEADKGGHDLRVLVGHAGVLDRLMGEVEVVVVVEGGCCE